jgi:formylglycine-generating enzyme required for sulfatase activity
MEDSMLMRGMQVAWVAATLLWCGCAVDELDCEPGKLQCVGNTRQSCGPDGRWQEEECASPWGVCDAGRCVPGPNCAGLPAACGPAGNEECCASSVVTGGTYNRSNDVMYPATVSDFRLDRFEITVGRFRAFVEAYTGAPPATGAGAHPLIPGSGWNTLWNVAALPLDKAALLDEITCSPNYGTWTHEVGPNENLPMNCISWFVAFTFCAWDGGRLPTEAEWNYAAAAGNEQREYPWSNPPSSLTIDGSYAVYDCMGDGSPAGVCSRLDIVQVGSRSPKGDGKWGQADLAGNLKEWNLDFYADAYSSTAACQDCANVQSGSTRVIRGGYYFLDVSALLSSVRGSDIPLRREHSLGARCARTP